MTVDYEARSDDGAAQVEGIAWIAPCSPSTRHTPARR